MSDRHPGTPAAVPNDDGLGPLPPAPPPPLDATSADDPVLAPEASPAEPQAPPESSAPIVEPKAPPPGSSPPVDPARLPDGHLVDAEEPLVDGDERKQGQRPKTRWYGWQMFAPDAIAAVLVAADVRGIGSLGYVLSGPMVHAVQRRGPQSFASLALRVCVPAITLLAAGKAFGCLDAISGECNSTRAYRVGVFTGAAIASGIDAALLARVTTQAPKLPPKIAFTPGLVLLPKGGSLLVSGAY